MMIHQILEYFFSDNKPNGSVQNKCPGPPTNGKIIAENDKPIDLMGCVYENIPPMWPMVVHPDAPHAFLVITLVAHFHMKKAVAMVEIIWRNPQKFTIHYTGNQTWLAGKSIVHGGFDGKIIYELAMFATFDYWRVYISPFITLTGWWFGAFFP